MASVASLPLSISSPKGQPSPCVLEQRIIPFIYYVLTSEQRARKRTTGAQVRDAEGKIELEHKSVRQNGKK